MKFNLPVFKDRLCFLIRFQKTRCSPRLWYPVVPPLFVKKTILSLPDCLCIFGENQIIYVWVYFWIVLFHLNTYLSLCQNRSALITVNLEIRHYKSFTCVLFQCCVGYFRSFTFPCQFSNSLVDFCKKKKKKKAWWDFIMYVDPFGEKIGMLTVLNVLIHEHDASLHLFRSSLTFLSYV